MGLRGPKPTPSKILELRGSPHARYQGRQDATVPVEIPSCPEWLDEDGKKIWGTLTQHLYTLGVVALVDRIALGRYVQLFQRWVKMEQFIKQYGETYPVKNADGAVVSFQAFPQVYIASNLSAQLARLEDSFGMTPSSRARVVQSGIHPEQSAFEAFIAPKPKGKRRA